METDNEESVHAQLNSLDKIFDEANELHKRLTELLQEELLHEHLNNHEELDNHVFEIKAEV